MAQIVIADHIFDVVKRNPVKSMNRTTDGGWIVVDTIESPKQIKGARALDKRTIDVIAYQGDGMDEADALAALAKAQNPVIITDGMGKSWGKWTIQSVTTKYERVQERGIAQVLRNSLSLLEYRQDEHVSISTR
ncbi:hypothetical protein G6Z94_11760 [Vibrio aestuarianus]|uniref:phage tail protein n=1 Tax=Vibrio aestuarianus TaxID=28171 RepID=UPI001594A720|nr:phage tail protein [Vibrio aestuarianus]NGZ18015.1 hypothetical protein [Vibrio aestuarianus]